MTAAKSTSEVDVSYHGTLGALLHAGPASTRVAEAEWVALVGAIARSDQQALYALYERAHRLVFTLALRITGDRATAEEVTVDVFHDVWRRAVTYQAEGGSVLGWIMNQARSRAIDRVRFERRKKRGGDEGEVPPAAPAARDPEELVAIRQERRVVLQSLALLTQVEREVIERAFFGELTYEQVANQLDEPVGTVKSRVRAALTKLREAMAQGRSEP